MKGNYRVNNSINIIYVHTYGSIFNRMLLFIYFLALFPPYTTRDLISQLTVQYLPRIEESQTCINLMILIRHSQGMDSFLTELGFCSFCLVANQMIGLTLCTIKSYKYICLCNTLVQNIFKGKNLFIITKILSRLSPFVLLLNFTCLLISYIIIILCLYQFTLFHKYLHNYQFGSVQSLSCV